jgi:hypothetical protein
MGTNKIVKIRKAKRKGAEHAKYFINIDFCILSFPVCQQAGLR